MSRIDVTKNREITFEALAVKLRSEGFEVDHFHAVEVVDGEEVITHIQEFSDGWDNDRGWEVTPQGWDKLVADEWHER